LRRAVEKYLEDLLAEELLAGNLRKSKPIQVLIDEDNDDKIKFVQDSGKDKVSMSSSDDEKKSDS
jgi:ATP-dependent Clp protease ATP-binding subunit ClpA